MGDRRKGEANRAAAGAPSVAPGRARLWVGLFASGGCMLQLAGCPVAAGETVARVLLDLFFLPLNTVLVGLVT